MGDERRQTSAVTDDLTSVDPPEGEVNINIGSAPLSLYCSGYTGQSRDLPDGWLLARVEGGRPDIGYIKITYTLRLTPQDQDGPYHVEEVVQTSDPGSPDTFNVLDFRRRPYDHPQQAIMRSRYKLMLELWTSETCYYVSELPRQVSEAIEDDACTFMKVAHQMLHDTGRKARQRDSGSDEGVVAMLTEFFTKALGGKVTAETVELFPERRRKDADKTDC